MNKTTKFLAFFAVLLVTATAGYAVWAKMVQSSPTAFTIVSEQPLKLVHDFDATHFVNATDTDVNSEDTLTIQNRNGLFNATVTIHEEKTDVLLDDCSTDWEGDCHTTYLYDGNQVQDGQNVTVKHGQTDVKVIVECRRWSCPQEIVSDMTIQAI